MPTVSGMTTTYPAQDNITEIETSWNKLELGQRILAVEDEEDLRQLNADVLLDAGYRVDVAANGAAAWAALKLHHYDLLITDQFMPKLSGVELLKKIHTAHLTLPVIMATEILPTWEFALHPCLQAVRMLRKPYTIEKFLAAVKDALALTLGTNIPKPRSPALDLVQLVNQ
jgi:DNA-binding NtrC family response regulator